MQVDAGSVPYTYNQTRSERILCTLTSFYAWPALSGEAAKPQVANALDPFRRAPP
jgi:hypothetical protein